MKRFLLATALLTLPAVACTPAFAQMSATSSSQAGSESASGSYSGVTQNYNSADPSAPGNIGDPSRPYTANNNERYGGGYTVNNVPDIFAPSFSGGTNTCMGPAVSGGVAVAGFGLGAGFSRLDNQCEYRSASTMLWLEGQHRAAVNELCFNIPGVSDAMASAGTPCPPNPRAQRREEHAENQQRQQRVVVAPAHQITCHYVIQEPSDPNGAADSVRVCN